MDPEKLNSVSPVQKGRHRPYTPEEIEDIHSSFHNVHSDRIDLFVYGTLMSDEHVKLLLNHSVKSEEAVLHNYMRVVPPGAFYFTVKQFGAVTNGRLLKDLTPEDIEKIDAFDNYDEIRVDLKNELDEAYASTMSYALKIRDARIKRSQDLERKIVDNLFELELKNTIFKIEFNLENKKFYDNGIDEVNFMVTFNKGEALKPLQKVASGGELSRFMLALKSILSSNMKDQTIIFDEIDSGVSGKVAYSIAQKIHSISEYAQVLCITHLPQVASICEHHISLSKEINNGRTITVVNELEIDDRITEIAKMISNGEATESSINLAKELIIK